MEAPNLALSKVVTHGSLRIGFTHGHTIIPPGDGDSLLIAARQMDVDVLLWGGTHKFEAYEMEGKFFVNPGSATGAMSTGWWPEDEDPTPSFVLMDVSLFFCSFTFLPREHQPVTHVDRHDVMGLNVEQTRKHEANQGCVCARNRCKVTCSSCTFTNSARTPKATRTSRWRRCHSGKTEVVQHRRRMNGCTNERRRRSGVGWED